MNLAVWVERHARRLPGAPALADGETSTPAGRVPSRGGRRGSPARDEFGLSPGTAAILMRNRPEYPMP
jgi:hypothetical protein